MTDKVELLAVRRLLEDDRPLERRLASVEPRVRGILERAVEGRVPTVEEGVLLLGLRGDGLAALVAAADTLRRQTVETS